jgi:hypothetical protein
MRSALVIAYLQKITLIAKLNVTMSASVDKLNNAKFNLDFSGVAGFFGGKKTVLVTGTMHLYPGQKWLGW